MPEPHRVDVTNMVIGQSIHVRDLVLPPGVEALNEHGHDHLRRAPRRARSSRRRPPPRPKRWSRRPSRRSFARRRPTRKRRPTRRTRRRSSRRLRRAHRGPSQASSDARFVKVILGLGNPDANTRSPDTTSRGGSSTISLPCGRSMGGNETMTRSSPSGVVDGIRTRLVKPQTYVNLSGAALRPYLRRPTWSAATTCW